MESSQEPREAWYQGLLGELCHYKDGPSARAGATFNLLGHGGERGAPAAARLGGKTSMQWVMIITYCCGNEAASGQAEKAKANGEPESQSRRRLGA